MGEMYLYLFSLLIYMSDTLEHLLNELDLPMGPPMVEQMYDEAKEAADNGAKDYDLPDDRAVTVCACVYLSARMGGYPMHPAEIGRIVDGVTIMDISREARRLNKVLGYGAKDPTAETFAYRYADALELGDQERETLVDMLDDLEDMSVGTRSVRAAATVYAASQYCPLGDDAVTQKEAADAANRSEVAIRKAYNNIRDELELPDIAKTDYGDVWYELRKLGDALEIEPDLLFDSDDIAKAYFDGLDDSLTEKSARGVAGACIYVASDDFTLADIEDAAGVTGQTVSRIGQELRNEVDITGVIDA